MEDILIQKQIDELIIALNNGTFQEQKTTFQEQEIYDMFSVRFKHNNVYIIEDYELFYCNYALEKLTTCNSILRRYAYGDIKSYKKYKYFMVLGDYQKKGINAVSVVGISLNELAKLRQDYYYIRNNGIIYLVDASSLSYAFSFINNVESYCNL